MGEGILRVLCVVGTRPNYIKLAPLYKELRLRGADVTIVDTGQHYDKQMAESFLYDFGIYTDYSLNVKGCDPIDQLSLVISKLTPVVKHIRPDVMVVFGDVTSTLASALVANKLNVQLAHVEAGLRSYDRTMPEENNRIITDHLSDWFFCSEEAGCLNLKSEGIDNHNVRLVGNIMSDTLYQSGVVRNDSPRDNLCVLTVHRDSTLKNAEVMRDIVNAVNVIADDMKVQFYVHPHTRNVLADTGIDRLLSSNIEMWPPSAYQPFMVKISRAKLVITDSGGLQAETTILNTPCITLRETTEQPVTVKLGTNKLTGTETRKILDAYNGLDSWQSAVGIPFWNGKTAKRIANVIMDEMQ